MKYKITDDCTTCGACSDRCKANAIVRGDEHYEITDACTSCGIALIYALPVQSLNIFQ